MSFPSYEDFMKPYPCFFLFPFLLYGCGVKPVACLSSNPTVSVGARISVTSCSVDADALEWDIEGGGEKIISGGGFCDRSMDISFSTKGEKTIRLIAWKFKKKSTVTCSEGLDAGKTDEATYKLTVE